MFPVFTETTCVLSSEYVSCFPSEKLAVLLVRIGKDACVECKEARLGKKSFSLVGDWANILKAHSILEEHFKNEFGDDIPWQKYDYEVNEHRDRRPGRKPGCTVEKSLYQKIPQPMLQYIDDKGATVPSIEANTRREEVKSKQDTEGKKDKCLNESLEKSNDQTVTENHNPVDADKHNFYQKDEEKSTDNPVENNATQVPVENNAKPVPVENNAKDSEVNVKTEFDDSVMDEDTDVEEQIINSPEVVKQKKTLEPGSELQVKIEIEDSDYEKQMIKSDPKSLQEKGSSKRKRTSKKKSAVKKTKGSTSKKMPKKNKTSIKSPPNTSNESPSDTSFESLPDTPSQSPSKTKLVKPKTEVVKTVKPKTNQDFKCDQCDYVGKKRENLREHKGRMHQIKFNCEICKKQFGLHKDLLRHTRYVHTTPSFHCTICDKTYKSNRAFKEHMLTHEVDYVKPQFECEICHKNFSTKYVLTSHVKSEHLGIKKSYICPTCGRSFTQKNSYVMHANVHAGIKPYVCDVCGKAFSYEKSLREHKYMHDEERRFECALCDKKFRQKTSLVMHQRVHKQAKDYICTACGKGFTQKQALLRHERIHSGDKPFKCALCSRSFNDYSIIRRHMMMHHKRDKDPKTWRGDIICTLKKKHEFYIEGGPGYNGGDQCPMGVEETKDQTVIETAKVTSSSENTENNGSTHNGVNYSVSCSDSANSVVDSSGYHVPDSCQAVVKLDKSELTNTSALPLNYSLPINFQPSVSVPSGQSATDEASARQFQDMIDYRNHTQRQEVFLSNSVNVAPITGLTSQSHISSVQVDTTQGQAGPNPWGLPGFPPYYTPANFSRYPGHQN